MKPAIRIDGLSKRYRLGTATRSAYRTLSETLGEGLRGATRRLSALGRRAGLAPAGGEFWALNDVSFEVQPGEVVGVIGPNGAGKSTLLKVLSRVVEPTAGRVEIRGRIGSLLEVGTGFHPELSGRENVYLNGSILGMSRKEIERKFDEIVAFAEVEKFLDTPVKRYSSGMYVRLGFAVAAYLEPEILIVDEVLSVGDIQFQKKCVAKMREVVQDGRTILLVSHNLATLEQLAPRSVLLERGRLTASGPTPDVVRQYQKTRTNVVDRYVLTGRPIRGENRRVVEFVWAALVDRPTRSLPADAPLQFDVRVRANEPCPGFRVSFTLHRSDGSAVGSAFGPTADAPAVGEERTYRFTLSGHRLAPGQYHLGMATGRGSNAAGGYEDYDIVRDVLHFGVMNPGGDDAAVAVWHPTWGPIRFEAPDVVAI